MELIHIYGVTVWNSVPAFMQMLAEYALEVKETAENLRVVMLSGDWIPLDLTAKIRRLSQQADIYSLGGATEASIWSNYYPIREVKPEWRSIPYGYPLSGQGFRILNDQMLDCPPNTIGKLYIFGTGVALGYLHDRALTGERFIEYGRTGERLYDTGDLGMYWNDGTIEFWGREDFQVKIRGHRIELGEIEAAVNQSHLVKEAAAMAVKVKGKPSLAAAIVPIDGSYPEEEILADALGEAQKRLPDYMIPSVCFVLPKMPLTGNGKIDRKELLAQAERLVGQQRRGEPEHKRDEIETLIGEIWQEVLGLDELPGLEEDFFDFGGDSIDIVKVKTKLSETLGQDIAMSKIFAAPTVSGMAQAVKGEGEGLL